MRGPVFVRRGPGTLYCLTPPNVPAGKEVLALWCTVGLWPPTACVLEAGLGPPPAGLQRRADLATRRLCCLASQYGLMIRFIGRAASSAHLLPCLGLRIGCRTLAHLSCRHTGCPSLWVIGFRVPCGAV